MVRVFHCDDSAAYRALIRAALADGETIEIVGEAADAQEAVAGVEREQPDVVLLDLLNAEGAEEIVQALAGVAPQARVVVLSGFPAAYGEARRGGAAAYVEKDASFGDLRETVLRIAGG